MSDKKLPAKTQLKARGRSKIRDVLPQSDGEDSPLNENLRPLLKVQKASILKKEKTFPETNFKRLQFSGNIDTSSGDSFLSAHSTGLEEASSKLQTLSIIEASQSNPCKKSGKVVDYVRSIESFPSLPLDNIEVIEDSWNGADETLPSYDEEVVDVSREVETEELNILHSKGKPLVEDILQNVIQEDYNFASPDQEKDDFAQIISSALTSQAFVEAYTEDTQTQIELLMKVKDEELINNKNLRARVLQLEGVKTSMENLVSEVECSYLETLSEMSAKQTMEIEFGKLQSESAEEVLESRIQDLTEKLTHAEKQISVQEALEANLQRKIKELEDTLSTKEKHCREELQELLAKYMKSELLAKAKEEVEEETINFNRRNQSAAEDDDAKFILNVIDEMVAQAEHQAKNTIMSGDTNLLFKPLRQLLEFNELQIEQMKAEKEGWEKMCYKLEAEKMAYEKELANAIDKDNTLEIERKRLLELEMVVQTLKNEKCKLEIQAVELLEKFNRISCEKDGYILKRISMDATLQEIAAERDKLLDKNKELIEKITENDSEREKRMALEAELEKLTLDFHLTATRNQTLELDVSLVRNELDELKCEMSKSRNSIGASDTTQYMDYPPFKTTADAICQTVASVRFESSVQTDKSLTAARRLTAEEFCPTCRPRSGRLGNLQQDLELSWTERCEVEHQLSAALRENAMLRHRILELEAASRRASGLVETGAPSAAVWLQLRTCVKEIVSELAVLRSSEDQWPLASAMRGIEPLKDSTVGLDLVSHINREREGRSSPEGGRESPPICDGALNVCPTNDDVHVSELVPMTIGPESSLLDQSSNALLEMVQGLLRCLGADDAEANGTMDGTFNCSFSDRLSNLPDTDELCQCLQQIRDEVGRLFALSRKSDPVTVKLQAEIQSLTGQVEASDKQLRSLRAFLDEQAAERETERDEAIQRIEELSELLRNRERQLVGKDLLQQDLETLEQQLVDVKKELETEKEQRKAADTKVEQMMQKVWTLREVLETLEKQLAETNVQLDLVKRDKTALQERLVQSGQLSIERENAQRDSYSDTLAYVVRLEEEVATLRHRIEATSPENLAAARSSIRDLQAMIARRTQILELVQVNWLTGVSSASEELSTRDVVDATRCPTPDEMLMEAGIGLCEDVDRLRERLAKHSRAEEAALKRIKDLEQIAVKWEEVQVDLEVAMRRVDSLLTENETLKIRLQDERLRFVDPQSVEELKAKVKELEKELEEALQKIDSDKRLVLEKNRREERLKDALETREAELLQESKVIGETQRLLEEEKALRLAAEKELSRLSEESLTACKRSFDGTLQGNTASLSSTSSSKKVRFCVPESFVESVTPISPVCDSLLRDAPSTQHHWILDDKIPQKSIAWDSVSSVAALQLSPRGASTMQEQFSLLQPSTVPYSSQVDNLDRSAEIVKLQETVDKLEIKLRESKENLATKEESHQQRLLQLANEMAECRKNMTHDLLEMADAKEKTENNLCDIRKQLMKTSDEVVRLNDDIAKYKLILEQKTNEFESEKDRHLMMIADLQCQLHSTVPQLEKQQKETLKLSELLKETTEELESVKSARNEMEAYQIKLNNEQESLDEVVHNLRTQMQENDSLKEKICNLNDELTALKNEKNSLLKTIDGHSHEIDSLQRKLRDNNEIFNEFKNQADADLATATDELKRKELELLEISSKIDDLSQLNAQFECQLSDSVKQIEQLTTKLNEYDRLKYENELLQKRIDENNSLIEHQKACFGPGGDAATDESERYERMEKLCVDAASRVSNLRSCLESSMLRSASLEAELAVVRSCLESSESKATSLEAKLERTNSLLSFVNNELETGKKRLEAVEGELQATVKKVELLQEELFTARSEANHLADKLQKQASTDDEDSIMDGGALPAQSSSEVVNLKKELTKLKTKEMNLEKALKRAIDIGFEGANREKNLKRQLDEAQQELLKLRFVSDTQEVNVRGLERLHHHGMALHRLHGEGGSSDIRSIRSAGDGADNVSSWRFQVLRLESYRKSLAWQKNFLQSISRQGTARSMGKPGFRTVVIMVIALVRMRFLVRRWKSRFPRISTPGRRKERPLMLTSPPSKDFGFSLNKINLE